MSKLRYLIFALILFYVSMWVQVNLFIGSIGKGKPPITVLHDSFLIQILKNRTGITVGDVKVSESSAPFGMMVGIPGHPQLILSRGLYQSFTPNELEYVVLHETGHYALQHSLKEFIFGLLLFTTGFFIIKKYKHFLHSIILGIFFGILMIQLGKYNEVQADNYAITHTSSPVGMITATGKFKMFYGDTFDGSTNKVLQWMFFRGNPYDNRIKMAKAEITKRSL